MSLDTFNLFLLSMLITACTSTQYPTLWWQAVNEREAASWEILPQAAEKNKSVILSKRNELGILSNFAATPFYYHAKKYASIEGFWQMMKYPDPDLKQDPRLKWKLPFTREEVSLMSAFDAKRAGEIAEEMMKNYQVDWVSFEGEKMTYCSTEKKQHYYLIREAMIKKLRYNNEVRRVLLATGQLKLLPDHHGEACQAPEWKYYKVWEELRKEVMRGQHLAPIMLPNP